MINAKVETGGRPVFCDARADFRKDGVTETRTYLHLAIGSGCIRRAGIGKGVGGRAAVVRDKSTLGIVEKHELSPSLGGGIKYARTGPTFILDR